MSGDEDDDDDDDERKERMKQMQDSKAEAYTLKHANLNEDDLLKILTKLSRPHRRRKRKRKRSRYQERGVAEILDSLPPTNISEFWEFDITGNEELGDAGMKHLHLIPDSVTHMDISGCGIGPIGMKRVCEFLKTNKFIIRLIIEENKIGDEGFKDLADMLKVNNTMSELYITDCKITAANCSHLSEGLAQNTGLRRISIREERLSENTGLGRIYIPDRDKDMLTDAHLQNLCPGLALNSGLEALDLSNSNHVTETGVDCLEHVLRSNVYLKQVAGVGDERRPTLASSIAKILKLKYWVDLNKCNRKLLKDPNCTPTQWRDAIIMSSEAGNPDAIYMFLTNKPEWCLVV